MTRYYKIFKKTPRKTWQITGYSRVSVLSSSLYWSKAAKRIHLTVSCGDCDYLTNNYRQLQHTTTPYSLEGFALRLVHQHMNGSDLNWHKLTFNKSTQLHDAFIGHARQRHDLIGCSETRTVSALNTCFPMRLFILEFANCSTVRCEQTFSTLWSVVVRHD